ncbi:TetR/AcrR family transcriptional regulator [Mycolicibacterium goodii]|uniref:TetR/AcrR family transcriptional regulator n=1 Tax=Mycolicibacterium goodii TaxID=134601 RepID=UPI000C25F8CA|nr:TetR/AcrR family transcriptional regulator [Mycolicibacterium goodii]PJK18414.1 TetR family transcriptional regulator [Mycolicibacterium goodii]
MAGRRAETTRESRAILLAAASELFVEKGYQQTTFADVAERSGISRGSIPWHFGSKEGLLVAVLEQASEALLIATGEQGEPASVSDYIGRAKGPAIVRTSLLFVALYTEAVRPESPIHHRYVALHDQLRGLVKAWVDQTVELPNAVSSDDLAAILVGAAIGIHLQYTMAPDKVDLDRTIDSLAQLLSSLTPANKTPGRTRRTTRASRKS